MADLCQSRTRSCTQNVARIGLAIILASGSTAMAQKSYKAPIRYATAQSSPTLTAQPISYTSGTAHLSAAPYAANSFAAESTSTVMLGQTMEQKVAAQKAGLTQNTPVVLNKVSNTFKYPDQTNIQTRNLMGHPIQQGTNAFSFNQAALADTAQHVVSRAASSQTAAALTAQAASFSQSVKSNLGLPNLAPKTGNPVQKIGNPYQIKGKWYFPNADPNYDKVGVASWYGPQFHGRKTANGEIFNMEDITAAHPTLPIPSLVKVTNLENGRELVVRLNDRGPFVDDRLIDLSRKSAELLGFEQKGTAKVRVEYLGPAGGAARTQPVQYTQPKSTFRAEPKLIAQSPIEAPQNDNFAYTPREHYVQVASFAEISNAEQLYRSLSVPYNVEIVSARVNGGDFFRVMVGPVSSKAAAEELQNRIARQGHPRGLVLAAR